MVGEKFIVLKTTRLKLSMTLKGHIIRGENSGKNGRGGVTAEGLPNRTCGSSLLESP